MPITAQTVETMFGEDAIDDAAGGNDPLTHRKGEGETMTGPNTRNRPSRCIRNRTIVGLGCSIMALAANTPVLAQTAEQPAEQPAETQGQRLSDIIVTATKREQNLQDVPVAVTAVGSERLQTANIESLEDLQVLVPNISFGNDFNVAKIFIRGVGTNTSTNGTDPAVALYVDGAVIARPEAQFTSLFDLERAEVLRGPQGTLFGRNAVGGAISLITAKPTRDLTGYARITYGSYNNLLAETAVGGTIIPGLLYGRAAVRINTRDGFGKNNFTGADVDDLNKKMGRIHLLFDGDGPVTFLLSAEFYDQDDNANAIKYKQAAYPGFPTLFPFGRGGFAAKPRDLNGEFDNRNQSRTHAFTGTLDWELSDVLDFKSITNYRKFNQQLLQDLDMSQTVNSLSTTGLATTIQNRNPYSRQISEEVQFVYTSDRIQGTVGAYYFDEKFGTLPNTIGLTPTSGQPQNNIALAAAGLPTSNPPIPRFNTIKSQQTAKAFALFGEVTFKLSDQFAIKAGGRYSSEKRTLDNQGIIIARGGLGPVLRTNAQDRASFKDFTPKAGLEYRPTDDIMVYYSYSEGFKSGSGELTITANPIIDPETIKAHELGIKTELFDRRVILNLAAFSNKLKGLQVNRTIFDPVAGFLTIYENATATKAHGVEGDISWQVADGFRVDLSGAYLNSEFDNFSANDPLDARNVSGSPVFAPVNVDLSGNATRYSPKWTFAFHPQYDLEMTNGAKLTFSTDIAYKTRQYHTEFNRPEMSTPAYTIVDASIRFTSPDGAISAQIFVENLFDKLVEAGTFAVSTSRSIGRTFLPPRVFGATLGYKF